MKQGWWTDLWRVLLHAQRRRAQAQVIGELDPNTLRDIGLDGFANEQERHGLAHSSLHRLGIG